MRSSTPPRFSFVSQTINPLLALLALAGLASPRLAAAAFPLEHSKYTVDIAGPVAEVTVEQVFRNTYESFIEAEYVFPLNEGAAVDAAAMHIGDREIRATIHRRAEAREIYEEAKEEGRAAALTEQERPNMFTQSVANIPPGDEIRVLLHVVQPLSYDNGVYSFTLPLVVGPRFIPAGVEDAAAISPPVAPTTPSDDQGIQHRVEIELHADLGLEMARVESPSHAGLDLVVDEDGLVELWADGLRATRDFVMEFEPEHDTPQLSFLAQNNHFSLLLEPQVAPAADDVVPRELIFVLDCSGSMSGTPMELSKAAMRQALENLLPGDSFQLIKFSQAASQLSAEPLPATPENIARGLEFIAGMEGTGGTYMRAGLEAAMAYPHTRDAKKGARKRILCLMTDGYIGNEREILALVSDRIGDGRVFAFGIGSSVNRYLLSRLAKVGHGHMTTVLLDDSPEDKVDEFYARIARPVLTDIQIDWGGMQVSDLYPDSLPDLYAGQPLTVTGRYQGEPGEITVHGRVGDGDYSQTLELEPVKGAGIASLWARARIETLEDLQLWGEVDDVTEDIVQTALDYKLLSQYTAFVAVERRILNTDGYVMSLDQPLEIPDGVSFDGVFGQEISRSHVRPGDPLLTVLAPAESRAVSALLPWGEMVNLEWDAMRERWYHRFLVPRGVEDGSYTVQVFVTRADGSLYMGSETLFVDGANPEFQVETEWIEEGTLIRLHTEEPLRSLQVYPLGQPELRQRLDLRKAPYAGQDTVEMVLEGHWDEVVVVVKDLALNRESQVLRPIDALSLLSSDKTDSVSWIAPEVGP